MRGSRWLVERRAVFVTTLAALVFAACASGTPTTGTATAGVSASPSPDETLAASDQPAPSAVEASEGASVATVPTDGTAEAESGRTLPRDPTAVLPAGHYRHELAEEVTVEFEIPRTSAEQWYGAGGPRDFQIRLASDPCDGCESGHIEVLVALEDVDATVAEWMELPGASFGEPTPVELGGAEGVEFTGTITSEDSIIHGGYKPTGTLHVYVLDVSGTTLVVSIDQFASGTDFLAEGERVVQSFGFS